MAVPFYNQADNPIDYSRLRALVVDDYPGMRTAMRITLSNFGLTRIDMSANATETLFRVQNSSYDLILCDFNLGDGRDGQQLLEELRHRDLISLDTVFIVVTAESVYEKVAATAELAPDDYIIKPFNAEILRNRLDTILHRKAAFANAYRHFRQHELEAALASCDAIIRDHPKYVVDALRFKGELLNAMGRFQDAEALYKQVIQMRAIPWARLGLARALHSLKREDEAEEELRDILEESPELVAAYDLMADVKLARKDKKGAQMVLEKGVIISGKTVRRQQKLGNIAFDNGDLARAKGAFSEALEKGRNSIFVTPADFGNLCRVQIQQGDAAGALDTLRKNRGSLQASPEGQLLTAVMQGVAQTRLGRTEDARRAMDEAARLRGSGVRTDENALLDLAQICLENGRAEESDAIIREVARNAHDSDTLLAKAKEIYSAAGRGDVADRILGEATGDVRKLNNDGVLLAHKGDFESAVAKLMAASREAPYNPRVLMNAAWVIMKRIQHAGMDHDLLDEAHRLMDEVDRQAPGHARMVGLRGQLKELEARFGITRSKGK